ncbi:putative low-complexity protein [Synechococcus sp. PCC 7502]|uniref:pentapeptide repeat-containing protein n=1 Tax=Synechococcus sp. PCC 7502 TaxID=1173263 RepID=UPI00029FE4DD|nr:pentapeptide repeat-containing protein [Synechococcus sp. PCC 7502]AFY73032.1 putative low-complexity protein [Synechococcus sp. PCC 7502]
MVSAPRLKLLVLVIASGCIAIAIWGLVSGSRQWVLPAIGVASVIVLPILIPAIGKGLANSPLGKHWDVSLAAAIASAGLVIFGTLTKLDDAFWIWFNGLRWDALGAVGQILIAILAVWVAWRQNEISEKLTGQQNSITQQQTIDTYFQGISDLILDAQGQMEDWPLERAIAQARTSALLGSSDADGRAKIIRFLSSANLLAPLKRDGLLGRAILDGSGGYVVDLEHGVRVINLGLMLAGKDISNSDLRYVDLTGANFIKTNFSGCNLTGANLFGAILCRANMRNTDLSKVSFFCGDIATASPRDRQHLPNFVTGEYTGAVVEEADFSYAKDLSDENRQYLCAWGGSKTRRTIAGGCQGVPNRLGR